MATKTVRVRTCDLCDSDNDAQPYLIRLPNGERYALDLCSEHSEPLREIVAGAPPRAERSNRYKVHSLAEIERMKKAGRA